MPPTRKYAGPRRPGERSAKVKKGKNFTYKTGSKAQGSTRRGNQNITMLKTLSNKTEELSISYRESLDFTNMGGKAGSSPVLIRADLNNPFVGLIAPVQGQGIVKVVGQLKTGSIDPIFTRHAYNNDYNLTDRLQVYASEYRSCIVTSAEVTFNVRPKLNQTWHNSSNRSLIPYMINQETEPGSGLYQLKTSVKPSASGDLYVWSIRQQTQNQLHSSLDGVYPLETLKQGVPGVRMTKLSVTPTSTRGCKMVLRYTPKSQYDISDFKDNKQFLRCLDGTKASPILQNANQKSSFGYLGIGGRINGVDPDPDELGLGIGLANCVVDVNVKYNLHFSERFNIDGNNEPNPHSEL